MSGGDHISQRGYMQLTPQQRQFLLMAMDPAAAPGEQAAAERLFFRSLRKAYHDGYAVLTDLKEVSNTTGVTPTTHASSHRYGSVTMPFGKHKGRKLSEIDATYLLWLLDNATALDRALRRAIERHLQDEQYAN